MANKSKPAPTYNISLEEFCRALERYNDRCGTCCSYGQMTHAIDSGRISRKEFFKALKGAIPV